MPILMQHQKNSLKERENVENRKGFLEFREETKIQKDLDGYLEWLRNVFYSVIEI